MKTLFTIATISTLAAAAPAAAQYANQGYDNQGHGNQANVNANVNAGIDNRIAKLDARLQAGIRQGSIDRQEAQGLRPQIRELTRLERQYSRGGLTQNERRDLQQRIRTVRQQLRTADRGSYDRYDTYGYNDADYDNDGYADNGAYGQGGPFEPACESRSGIGGVIDNIFGGNDDCAGLQVGARASGNLYGVPAAYRNQYRDSANVYYRSDGRRIYQIDARTDTVVRAFPMNR